MKQQYKPKVNHKNIRSTSSYRDSQVYWATNALRIPAKNTSAIALQERNGELYVCTKKGEETYWSPAKKVLNDSQIVNWIKTGGFPKMVFK